MSTEILNLDNYRTAPGNKIFSGRPRGETVRARVNLDENDRKGVQVNVLIPEDTFTLNLSFFLGLFADTIKRYGPEWFNEHYKFAGPAVHLKELPYYIEQALKESIPLPKVEG